MDKPWIHYTMRQTQKDKYCVISLNEVPKVEWCISGTGRDGSELNRLRVSARGQENTVEAYSGGSCTRWMCLTALKCIVKNSQSGLPWCLSGKEPACRCRRHGFSLVREDPACCRATKPACHNYWPTQSPSSATRKATAMRGLRTASRE